MAKLCTIYALSDPRLERTFENVRYVGKTESPLIHRLNGHIYKTGSPHKDRWIAALKLAGLTPVIWPLAFCCEDNWGDVERFWISKLRVVAHLTNVQDGGGGDVEWTKEIRLKISESSANRIRPPRTPEQIERQRQKMIGRAQGEDQIENRAAKLRGQKRSPETIALMRKIQSSRSWSRKGVPCDEQTKLKISKAKIGKPMPAQTKAALILKNSRPVLCVETGQSFASSKEAAIFAGVAHATMCRAALHGILCRGLTWRKVEGCQEQP